MSETRWEDYTDWNSAIIELIDYSVTLVKFEEDDPMIRYTPFCRMWGEPE